MKKTGRCRVGGGDSVLGMLSLRHPVGDVEWGEVLGGD